jgi:hypothetical protein
MIEDGLMAKVIIPKLEDDGLKAYIGDNWFYFGGSEFEYTDPKDMSIWLLAEEIKSALDSLDDVLEGNDGEYLYYYYYLCEMI